MLLSRCFSLVGCAFLTLFASACAGSDEGRASSSSALSTSDGFPSGNVYLRSGDVYPRSATAVFYAPNAGALRFSISTNDRDAQGQIVTGQVEGMAKILRADPATALYDDASCSLSLHAENPGDPLEASIAVVQTGSCGALGATAAGGVYRVTMIGD
jgi:hypothetical protein